jgi:hypothetical protein
MSSAPRADLSPAQFALLAVIAAIRDELSFKGRLYMAYTPFKAMLFDRLVAFSGRVAPTGFLIYVADATSYLGSAAVLVWRNFGAVKMDWPRFRTLSAMRPARSARCSRAPRRLGRAERPRAHGTSAGKRTSRRSPRSPNLVLWRWGADLPQKISIYDPTGKLPKNQLSWT